MKESAPQKTKKHEEKDMDEYQGDSPSMTISLLVYWILPLLLFAAISRWTVDTTVGTIPVKPASRPIQIQRRRPVQDGSASSSDTSSTASQKQQQRGQPSARPSPQPTAASRWPTAYRQVVETIQSRRRYIEGGGSGSMASPASASSSSSSSSTARSQQATTTNKDSTSSSRGPPKQQRAQDAARDKLHQQIALLKEQHEEDPTDLFLAAKYADAMRFYDVQIHDGGSYERQAIQTYQTVVDLALARRQRLIEQGKPTDRASAGATTTSSVNDEVTLDYSARSADGILCGVYTAQGKTYFMANMFERAVESYTNCLQLQPGYLDAVNARGSSYIILGRLQDAGTDLLQVIQQDTERLFPDAFQGLARVLQAQENAVPGGWDGLVTIAEELVPKLEQQLSAYPQAKQLIAPTLSNMYHALFLYHDVKTDDRFEAFRHLTAGYKHKLSQLPPWQAGSELAKIVQTKKIFTSTFWPPNVGSPTRVPIFIVGFVRSGSTLLERILDAHPLIVGTGENSVFNGRLPDIRNQIVQQSMTAPQGLADLTRRLAEDVVEEMKERWQILESNTIQQQQQQQPDGAGEEEEKEKGQTEPQRFVDKMLTNYYNIGFIQMLYPNALILHVVREPMDTIFSAYKHEFPTGTLDYTCTFDGLTELYQAYRDVMRHWDEVLPGRVTHIRYEDMVHDMPGMARAIIAATGLEWDDTVLEFHKKKHAVNTLSTTQVRKGIYKDSLQSWRRYEKQLQPLVDMVGDLVDYDLKTSLAGYKPPPE